MTRVGGDQALFAENCSFSADLQASDMDRCGPSLLGGGGIPPPRAGVQALMTTRVAWGSAAAIAA
jgi:hypothetical protein